MLQTYFHQIIASLGDDPERPGLKDTPKRAAQALQFLTQGYTQSIDEVVNGALFPATSDEMILIKNIELYSLCEHHLLPFIGKCHIAYIPDGKIIGLSKIARIVDLYARRLQVQENLTKEIADTIQQVAQAKGVGIIIEAQHLCMMMRGVEKQNSIMTTSVMLGTLREDPQSRAEFFNLVHRG
ncbi:MAG: GTP cyclohydrolase I FolE [Gammaproteobacteria bacterium RIFCSPHIGHO2_12_FULL_42_10]|nr:MAG: GTP cyclohydrolase I FolE [Gammaproteobacteria bacterium RIFCSPHIGHO2_12_FULL_42_10]